MFPSQGLPQQSPVDVNHYQDRMLNLVYNVCSIVTGPIEMVLRPCYGSRYFPPMIQFFTGVMMALLPFLVSFSDGLSHMLPFARFRGPTGLFGIDTLSKLYFAGSMVHGVRIWRRMIKMNLEQHSVFEGPPLPIFHIIPGFWRVRIIAEPFFVFALALVLSNFYTLQPPAAHFLMFSAVMLAMKQYCAWYMQWQFLRGLMDMRNAGPIIAKIVDNTASDEDLATFHLASLPKDIPDDVRRETASHIARAFTGKEL